MRPFGRRSDPMGTFSTKAAAPRAIFCWHASFSSIAAWIMVRYELLSSPGVAMIYPHSIRLRQVAVQKAVVVVLCIDNFHIYLYIAV